MNSRRALALAAACVFLMGHASCPKRNDVNKDGLTDHMHPPTQPQGIMVHQENGTWKQGEAAPPKGMLDRLLGIFGATGLIGGGTGILGLGLTALTAYRKYREERRVNHGMLEAHDHWIGEQGYTDKERDDHLREYREAHVVAGVRDPVKQRLKVYRKKSS